MQYVLGNMLNGGGGLNADGLSLDLQFAADKTLTARRGPTPTFTRSSGDNGGTTYFGPLVDFDEATAFSTTGIANGRASWFKSYEGTDITISYTGTRWSVVTVDNGDVVTFLAAPGGEWRPDQADWSGEAFSVTTSSTFGIVKAANNEPRFDHNPTSPFACRGLLIEESRTNSFQRSDDFENVYWTKLRSTITSDATTSPSGATDADKLVEDTSTNSHIVYRLVSIGVTTPVSFSVFAKASERSWIQLECGDNFTAGSTAYFNLSNGTIGTVGAGATASIQSMGNGWYRCVVVATPTATTSNGFYVNIATANGTRFYAGDGTSGVFLWGAQVEAGSFPTSYIPTTTSGLARSADVCNITGGGFNNFYNQSEGTMLANSSSFAPQPLALPSRRVVTASDGTSGNRVAIGNIAAGFIASGLSQALIVVTGGSPQSDIGIAGLTLSSLNKTAAAYKGNDFAVSTNSSAVVTDVIGSVPTNLNRLEIGNQLNNDFLCGHIASIRYYKKRLPNAKLVTLTT
jgi:hypothetical protein